jgi:hypothetical protein
MAGSTEAANAPALHRTLAAFATPLAIGLCFVILDTPQSPTGGQVPLRWVFTVAAVIVASAAISMGPAPSGEAAEGALASLLPFASAATAADTDLTPVVLKARKAVGLPAVGANPAVRAAARAVLEGGDPQEAFTSEGGTGDLITAKVPAGGALSTAELKEVVFDPRVTAIAVQGRDRNVAVAAALDPGRPFRAPVLAGAVVDPGVAGSLAVLVPPESGTIPEISLQRYRGGQLVSIEVAATAAPGAKGAILVGLEPRDRVTGPQVGYGTTYTLKIGTNRSYTVRTRPIPSALVSRSFVPGPGFAGGDRRRFMQVVNSLPPAGRKIVDIIGGAVSVSVVADSALICGRQTSCAGYDPGKGYFMMLNRAQLRSDFGRFVIAHEIGHLVDFLGLDTLSYEAFRQVFSRSPKWKNCFSWHGQCVPFLEVFADQFGFYVTNSRGGQSGYGDDRLATAPAFATRLKAQWSFRPPQNRNPLAGFGPLAQSFEDALHSSRDEL